MKAKNGFQVSNEFQINKYALDEYKILFDLKDKYKDLDNNTIASALSVLNNDTINSDLLNYKNDLFESFKFYSNDKHTLDYDKIYRTLIKIKDNEDLNYILNHVHPYAKKLIKNDASYRENFSSTKNHNIVVMSIDIRRSTELMLKAKTPIHYAEFITGLSNQLSEIILTNYGIFDKFTGDGILAFFPEFYSGEDAIGYALKAAQKCHAYFDSYYHDNRSMFKSVVKKIGLGIGIDLGNCVITRISNDITVVGEPVVYACRFSSADANTTVLNQTAFETLLEKYKKDVEYSEVEIDVKHESSFIGYKCKFTSNEMIFSEPVWLGEEI